MELLRGFRYVRTTLLRSGSVLGLMLSLVAYSAPVASQDNTLEYRVKAAFIYNFTKFIDWPAELENSAGELLLCVAGNSEFNETLKSTVGGKTKDSRTLVSKLVEQPGQATGCQVLFVGFGELPRLRDWVGAVAGNPILTISENDRFVESGGMIQFVIVDGKIRFDINQDAVNNSQLQMSSRLLSLARNVKR